MKRCYVNVNIRRIVDGQTRQW